jgi:SAM-dependent methyltransferase
MDTQAQVKRQVREFYDQVGWKEQSDGFYQNATYEDLRPVSYEYIHKCHLRVLRHLHPHGRLLLDAGCGPIQYPEYLEYSRGYQHRLCADISLLALNEARKRIGSHGLYVVCDVAYLPFKSDCFDGEVSLHTLHHLPLEQHVRAYQELYRTLTRNGRAVIVNGWYKPPLAVFLNVWINLYERLYAIIRPRSRAIDLEPTDDQVVKVTTQRGTYVHKENAAWLQREVGRLMPIQIWCWRSVSVRFLRTFIHERFGGKFFLKILYWKEELLPHFLGRYGQYPLVELTKRKLNDGF